MQSIRSRSKINQEFMEEVRNYYSKELKQNANLSSPGSGRIGRYTGKGADDIIQENEVAGVTHEDEFVVNSDYVRAMGGPKGVQNTLSKAAPEVKPKYSVNDQAENSGYVRSNKLPGYQVGGPVKSVINNVEETPIKYSEETVSYDQNIGEQKENPVKISEETKVFPTPKPEPITTDPALKPHNIIDTNIELPEVPSTTGEQASYQNLENDQITELQKIAKGEGMTSSLIAKTARNQLAGRLAAGNVSSEQAFAQSGLTGGELAAARARQSRDSSLAMTGLEGQLAIDAANRADNAVLQLVDIANRGKQFEEMKRQFGANFDLQKANFGLEVEKFNEFKQQFNDQLSLSIEQTDIQKQQFNQNMDLAWNQFQENVRQFDKNTALTMFLNDSRVNMWKADTLMTTGRYDAAATIYKDTFGINVDMTDLIDSQNQSIFGQAISNLGEDIGLLGDTVVFETDGKLTSDGINSAAGQSLIRAWNAMHPDNAVSDKTANTNSEFLKWSSNTLTNVKARQSPYYSMIHSYNDNELEGLIKGIETIDDNGNRVQKYTDLDEFKYAGQSGIDAVRTAFTNLWMTGGLRALPDGSLEVDYENPAWEPFNMNIKSETSGTTSFKEQLSNVFNPEDRLSILENGLSSGEIKITDFSQNDINNLKENNDILYQKYLDQFGLDANISKIEMSNILGSGETDKILKENNLLPEAYNAPNEKGSWNYDMAYFTKDAEGNVKGKTIRMGDKNLELLGIINMNTAIKGGNNQMYYYELDENGNRTTEKPLIMKG